MAPRPTSPGPAAKSGGNVLTKKFGPLPGWAWAGLGVLGFFIYKQRKASEASNAAAASTTGTGTSADDLTAATSPEAAAPTGYGYQGPGVGSGGSGAVPTGAMAHTGRGRSGVSSTSPSTTTTTSTAQPSTATLDAEGVAQGENTLQASNNANADTTYYDSTGQVSQLQTLTEEGIANQPTPGSLPLSWWNANGGFPGETAAQKAGV